MGAGLNSVITSVGIAARLYRCDANALASATTPHERHPDPPEGETGGVLIAGRENFYYHLFFRDATRNIILRLRKIRENMNSCCSAPGDV